MRGLALSKITALALMLLTALMACASHEYDPQRIAGIRKLSELRRYAESGDIARLQMAAYTYAATFGLAIRGDELERTGGNLRCTIVLTDTEKDSLRQAIAESRVLNGVDGAYPLDTRWVV